MKKEPEFEFELTEFTRPSGRSGYGETLVRVKPRRVGKRVRKVVCRKKKEKTTSDE